MDSAQLLGFAIHSLWRNKFSAAFAFALTILLVLTGIAICPRKYRSEAKLFVRLGRETVALDPTATTGQTVAIQSSREIEVRSVRDMLSSRILMEQVVQRLGADYVLDPPFEAPQNSGISPPAEKPRWIKDSIATLRTWAAKVRLSDPVPDGDLAVRDLEKGIEIDGGSKSSVISVEYITDSPSAAQKVLETFLDSYRELHVRVNRASENYAFFSEQTEEISEKLQLARSELERLKNEKGVVEINVRKQNLQEHVSQLDVETRSVQAKLAAAEASLRLSKEALGLLPDRLLTDQVEGLGDAARDSIRNTLYQMEMEAERVKQSYAAGHPERERVLAQVESMKKIYEGESTERPTQTSTVNQAHQEVQLKVIDTEASLAGITAELKALRQQKEEVAVELTALNQTEMQLAKLQEQVDLLKDNHRKYAENLELSRIDDELRKETSASYNLRL
jgi:polysaccharide biosynthesis protein PslE